MMRACSLYCISVALGLSAAAIGQERLPGFGVPDGGNRLPGFGGPSESPLKVTKKDRANAVSAIRKVDTNKDGVMSREELRNSQYKKYEERRFRFDADRNHQLTVSELADYYEAWIDEHPDAISKEELDSWIEKGSIEYLGYLDDVRPAIEESTVYVLPSYREGTPRTVLEAMAMGRPIITTEAPGCRETVIDGENGFLVPVRSVDALVEAMQRFIDNPELAIEMGRRSREIAEEKYDVRKVNAVMLREMGIN